MHDTLKTLIALGAAAALSAAAWLTRPAGVSDALFSDVGEVFAPHFTDPLAAKSLEVVSFDEPTASFRAFKVAFDGQRWVIPSHDNYPADAAEKVAEAAAALIGLRKERVVSDSAADHESLGVLAPDDDAAPLSGRGVRVTVRGESNAPLASLILGKPLEDAGWGQRYIREDGKARVYVATLAAPLSTAFADWIDTDLLQLKGASIERVSIDRYNIDETSGAAQSAERITVQRDPFAIAGQPQWRLIDGEGGPLQEGESLDETSVQNLAAAFANIRIVGVRPKPDSLAKALAGEATEGRVTTGDLFSLQSRGFYISQDGRLLANDGQITATTDAGIVYTLWFGEIAPGEGDALTIGLSPEQESAARAEAQGQGDARYLIITVAFDESAVPAGPEPAPLPDDADEASREKAEAERAAYDMLTADRAERLAAGRETAAALSRRYANWYYVIDAASFDALRVSRADLLTRPTETDAPIGPPIAPYPNP